MEDDESYSDMPKPRKLSRPDAIRWVQKILERSCGLELPGNINPLLISQLFWEQSQPWEGIAAKHIEKVSRACKDFVYMVLKHTVPPDLQERLASLSIDSALASAVQACKEELRKIVKDKSRHPMTYNHYFTTTLQKQQQRKFQKITNSAAQASEVEEYYQKSYHTRIDQEKMKEAMAAAVVQDMDKFGAAEALDNQRAYYKDEMKYFVNAVAKQVIERHLIGPLPDIILSPLIITQLSDREVESIAAEPPEITQQRAFLETRKQMLEKGLETFSSAMGGLKH